MIHCTIINTLKPLFRLLLALPLLATIVFSVPLWSADNPETPTDRKQSAPENDNPQDPPEEEPETPKDFKPSEEISEDFPVPLPSDI